MRENGVPLAKSARAASWWSLAQRRSTKEPGGVHTAAEGSAQAVGSVTEEDAGEAARDGAALAIAESLGEGGEGRASAGAG
jgi:hypothetical protein